MHKAAFLDRDGVINRKAPEGEYITSWKDMHFIPGVAEGVAVLNRSGFKVIIISNQRCVAKGLLSISKLESMHRRMSDWLLRHGSRIDAIYYCPHEKQPPCSCRKPSPGMLLTAAREHEIDLSTSWMIGDSDSDIKAGKNAGCKTARVQGHNQAAAFNADVVASSLLEAVDQLLRWENTDISQGVQK
jgi:histidinol-phosphate phosphatase family protein